MYFSAASIKPNVQDTRYEGSLNPDTMEMSELVFDFTRLVVILDNHVMIYTCLVGKSVHYCMIKHTDDKSQRSKQKR